MKVIFYSGNEHVAWGGSEELWSKAAAYLATHTQLVPHAFIRHRTPPVPKLEALRQQGVTLHPYKDVGSLSLSERLAFRLTKSNIHTQTFRKLLALQPNLIVISLGMPFNQAHHWLRQCIEHGLKYVLIVQLAAECFWPSDVLLNQYLTFYQKAEKVFFVSEGNKALMERQFGLALPNAEVVFNPFTVPFENDFSWPDEDGYFHLACVGRIEPVHKGHDLLLEIMKIPQWKSRPLKIHCYGGGGNLSSVNRLKDHYGITNVHFYTHVSNIASVWEKSHACIVASRMEGMPLAQIEAMLCNRMAIVTDVAGNAEIIEDGKTGFVAEAATIKHLEEAMERAWEARDRWKEMGMAAGTAIRQMVPRNPAAVLANKLVWLLS